MRGIAQIGFHAQQAIEKLLKGLLTSYGVEPEDQHSLGRPAEQVRRLDRETADRVGDVSALTQCAVFYRYPPRVAGRTHNLGRASVVRDPDRARDAFPVLLAAIDKRRMQGRSDENG